MIGTATADLAICLFAAALGLTGCAAPSRAVDVASLSADFDVQSIEFLRQFDARTPDRLVSVSYAPHWGEMEIVDRRIVSGMLTCIRYGLTESSSDEQSNDVARFDSQIRYQTSDPQTIDSFRSLCSHVRTAGSMAADGTGVMFPSTTWHIATEFAAVSSCTPPLALDGNADGVTYTQQFLNYVARFPERQLVNPHEPFQEWDGWMSRFPPHEAIFLHLNIRTFDLMCRARWVNERRASSDQLTAPE